MSEDKLFTNTSNPINTFKFDESVADVFSDMIKRSVPGYELVLQFLAVITKQYAQDNSKIYDLGCSLGAATISMHQALQASELAVDYVAIDNSEAMVKRCKTNLKRFMAEKYFSVSCDDINTATIESASVITSNFTLQFVESEKRQALINRIYSGLNDDGVFFLSEKVVLSDIEENTQLIDWYHAFKKMNGYSDLEIKQKRAALENVLVADSLETHKRRLVEAGFSKVYQVYQGFNFISLVAIK